MKLKRSIEPLKTEFSEKHSSWSYLTFTLVPLLIMFLIIILASSFGENIMDGTKVVGNTFLDNIGTKIGQYLLQYSVYALIIWFFHKKDKISIRALSFKPKAGWKNYVLVILSAAVCLAACYELVTFITDALRTATGSTLYSEMPFPLDGVGWLFLSLFMLAVLPAIFEEILFRGILTSGFKKFGMVFAVFTSSALFSIGHGNAIQTIYQFILGAAAAFIFLRTASLTLSIVFHFVNNALVIIISFATYVPPDEFVLGGLSDWSATRIGLAFVYFVVGMVALYLLLRLLHNGDEKRIKWKDRLLKQNCPKQLPDGSTIEEPKQSLKTFSIGAFFILILCTIVKLFFWVYSWFS